RRCWPRPGPRWRPGRAGWRTRPRSWPGGWAPPRGRWPTPRPSFCWPGGGGPPPPPRHDDDTVADARLVAEELLRWARGTLEGSEVAWQRALLATCEAEAARAGGEGDPEE